MAGFSFKMVGFSFKMAFCSFQLAGGGLAGGGLSIPGFRVFTFLIERCCGHKVYMSAVVRRLLEASLVLAHAVQGPRGRNRPFS